MGWAKSLNAQGKYDESIDKYKKVIEINQENKEASYEIGILFTKQEGIEEENQKSNRSDAVFYFERAIKIDKLYSPAHLKLLEYLLVQKKYKDANKRCKKSIKIYPSYFRLHMIWGDILAEKGDLEGAINKYAKVIKIIRDSFAEEAEARIERSTSLLKMGKSVVISK